MLLILRCVQSLKFDWIDDQSGPEVSLHMCGILCDSFNLFTAARNDVWDAPGLHTIPN